MPVTIKQWHVLTPVLLLPFVMVGLFLLLHARVPELAALLIPDGLVAIWVYYDSRAVSLKYSREWQQAELTTPDWLGVTVLIFAPLGLPLYTYQLHALNNALKTSV